MYFGEMFDLEIAMAGVGSRLGPVGEAGDGHDGGQTRHMLSSCSEVVQISQLQSRGVAGGCGLALFS